MPLPSSLEIRLAPGLAEVPAAAWDALTSPDDPFTEHAFLLAMEDSGSVGAQAGWLPQHVLVHEHGHLVGAMPLYLKTHSYGEYIFDWGWADAAQRAGIAYYPKLVSAVPFTPATGRRLLVGARPDGAEAATIEQALLSGALHLARAAQASSLHVLFCPQDQHERLCELGMIGRKTFQFHWENDGYADFEDWLSRFRSRRRKECRRERRLPEGVVVLDLPGGALSLRQQARVRAMYEDTCDKRGGHAYLHPEHFELFWTDLAHRSRVLLAEEGGRTVAMALLFQRGGHLYGRYWGCRPGYEGLHFELCYHRPIEICITEGLRRFEAGAQGTHKIHRGLLPSPTWSAHWLDHAGLAGAVAQACARERRATETQMAELAAHGPLHRESDTPGGASDAPCG